MLPLQPLEGVALSRAPQFSFQAAGELQKVGCVAPLRVVHGPAGGQPLQRILPDCLQHAKAGLGVVRRTAWRLLLHQALVHQRGQGVQGGRRA